MWNINRRLQEMMCDDFEWLTNKFNNRQKTMTEATRIWVRDYTRHDSHLPHVTTSCPCLICGIEVKIEACHTCISRGNDVITTPERCLGRWFNDDESPGVGDQ